MKFKQVLATVLVLVMLCSTMSVFAEEESSAVQPQTAQSETQTPTEAPSSSEETASSEAPSSSEAVSSSEETASSEEAASSEEQPASSEEAAASEEKPASSEEVIASSEEAPSSSEAAASSDIDAGEEVDEAEVNAMANATGATEFVTRLYNVIFNRTPSQGDLNSWVPALVEGRITGASVMLGFFEAYEYTSQNKSDTAYITDLYAAALGRQPDAAGMANWLKGLNNMLSRKFCVSGFAASPEFQQMCYNYGIQPGTITLTENRDMNVDITAYVTRLYRTALSREPDIKGLNDWTGGLNAHIINGAQALDGFFSSEEYAKKGTTDTVFLQNLYSAAFNREPDQPGITGWLTALNSMLSRRYCIKGFCDSQEFIKMCNSYGVVAGTIALTENRDMNIKTTTFVVRVFETALGRKPDIAGLNSYTGGLNSRTINGAQVVKTIFNSVEYAGRGRSNSEFINDLYIAMFGHAADAAGLSYWLNIMTTSGCSYDYIIKSFAESQEFISTCANYGITAGTITLTENRDKDVKVSAYIMGLFKNMLNRAASAAELNNFAGQVINNKLTSNSLVTTVASSGECTNYFNSLTWTDKSQIVKCVYLALLGRYPSQTDINNGLYAMNTMTYVQYAQSFFPAAEYKAYAKSHDINPTSYGTLRVTDTSGVVHEGPTEEILANIVAGEVGGMANVEVYKAQAIAAHSWILYKNKQGDTAPTVAWGTPHQTIKDSVEAVAGKVVYYNGAPAMTTYFASCNNVTNSAAEVWGNSVPYLVSVASSYDSAVASNWQHTMTLNQTQLKTIINKIYYSAKKGNPIYMTNEHAKYAEVTSRDTNNGYVLKLFSAIEWYNDDNNTWYKNPSVGGRYFWEKANQAGIALRSPNFTVKYNYNYTWTFTSYGYGHGVGMSQWGAYGYATRAGWNYAQILQHYYPGTTINDI